MEYRQKAEGCLSFKDFVTLLESLLKATMPNVTFISAYSRGSEADLNKNPIITYKVVNRQVAEKEIKPRPREVIEAEEEAIVILGQRFDYVVEFNIWGDTNEQAEEILDRFEDVINTYRGNLQRSGVQQIIFLDQKEDNPEEWKNKLICRPLHYLVRLERLTIWKEPLLKTITVRTDQGLIFEIIN